MPPHLLLLSTTPSRSLLVPQCSYSHPPIPHPKRVVLVRHGQSTWNEEGRIQGSSDHSVLTPKGLSQADTSRLMLAFDSFDVCFSSPLRRSRRTAEIIWGDARPAEMVVTDSDLREIDLYSFQGLLKHEGKERFGEQYKQWQKDAPNFSIDGHYPVRELWDRARNCWPKILAHEGKSVLVVAHNAVNQALVATALGLETQYFRLLLQSNCGVSVLDFTPSPGGSPKVCLNRMNQTPNSPISFGEGRKAGKRIILVCHGATQSSLVNSSVAYEPMNMLGVIQSQKIAELLLDVNVNTIICGPRVASVDTATAISEVQEAAECLGADCVTRDVEVKQMLELEVEHILHEGTNDTTMTELWGKSKEAWDSLMVELSDETKPEKNVVVVGHPAVHIALIAHCLRLKMERMENFHLDPGSISVLDFPDGPYGKGVVRCVNYTAHLGRWSIPVTRPMSNNEEF